MKTIARNLSVYAIALLSTIVSSASNAEFASSSPQAPDFRKYVRSAPKPVYPASARLRQLTGSGIALLKIDTHTGRVVSVSMLRSTGHKILDDAALRAYDDWTFRPETISEARIPVTFTLTGVPLQRLNAARDAISAPAPKYPTEAQLNHWTGGGSVLMDVDSRTGHVTSSRILESTGHAVLDNSAVEALSKWRFRPGTQSPVRIPITFTERGVKYE